MDKTIKLKDRLDIAIQRIDYAQDMDQVPYFSGEPLSPSLVVPDRQVDLAYGEALYVSKGGNKNG